MKELDTILDLLTRSQFKFGIAGGSVSLLVLYGASRCREEVRGWGLALSAVVFIGINFFLARRLTVLVGLALIALGATMLGASQARSQRRDRVPKTLSWMAIALGLVIFTWRAGLPNLTWAVIATPAVVIAVGYSLYHWIDSEHLSLIGPLVAVTAIGLWTTVPETDTARVFLGAALPLSVATLSPIRARLTPPGAFVLGTVFAWLVPYGGLPRPASIIGGWGCIGVIALLPLVLREPGSRLRGGGAAILLIHVATVVISARLIGLGQNPLPASAAIVLLGLVVYGGMSMLVARDRDSTAAGSPETAGGQ